MNLSALKRILDPDRLLDATFGLWTDFFKPDEDKEVQFDGDTALLESVAMNRQSVFLVLNYSKMRLEYVGKNIEEAVGYSSEEFMKGQFLFVFKILKFSHTLFFARVIVWMRAFLKNAPSNFAATPHFGVVCGLAFQHKTGEWLKTIITLFPHSRTKSGLSQIVICEIMDATTLLKCDDYWFFVTSGKENPFRMTFFSKNPEEKGADLISPRELEIVKLVAEGFSSKEIGERLFISPLTVEKHRKNMLARTGARDTTALVEICRICGVL